MKAIVSLSGGRDSGTLLAKVVKELGAENVYAISFEYGSKHPAELECAKKLAKYYGIKEHKIINIDPSIFQGSTCTMLKGGGEVQKDMTYDQIIERDGEGQVDTYVPARNFLYSAYACAYAESKAQETGDEVTYYLGQHADDAAGAAYSDAVAKGSMILMADGTEKKIEDVKVGDLIWAFNTKTRRLEKSQVFDKIFQGIRPVYATGGAKVSANHIMWRAGTPTKKFCPFSDMKRKDATYKAFRFSFTPQKIENENNFIKGYLWGLIEGDGWQGKSHKGSRIELNICQKDESVLKEVSSLFRKVYHLKREIRTRQRKDNNMYVLSFGVDNSGLLLADVDGLLDNRDFRLGYLNGMIIAEGCYNGSYCGRAIEFCQSEKANPEKVKYIDECMKVAGYYHHRYIGEKDSCVNWKIPRAFCLCLKYGAGKLDSLHKKMCKQVKVESLAPAVKIDGIVSAEYLGEQECYDLTTSAGSYFADGLLVHNCSPAFTETMAKATEISSEGRVHTVSPFINLHKSDIIELAIKLGLPLEYTLSCYDPVEKDSYVEECGRCATCLDVKKAMEKNGLEYKPTRVKIA